MMKLFIFRCLPMFTAAAMTFALIACSDDDNNLSEQEKEKQMEQELDRAAEFWSVVG